MVKTSGVDSSRWSANSNDAGSASGNKWNGTPTGGSRSSANIPMGPGSFSVGIGCRLEEPSIEQIMARMNAAEYINRQMHAAAETPTETEKTLESKLAYAQLILEQLEHNSFNDVNDKEPALQRIQGYITTVESNEDLGLAKLKAQLYIAAQKVLTRNQFPRSEKIDKSLATALLSSLKEPEHPLRKDTLSWLTTTNPQQAQISVERFLTLVAVISSSLTSKEIINASHSAIKKIFKDTPILTKQISSNLTRLERILSLEKVDEIRESIRKLQSMLT